MNSSRQSNDDFNVSADPEIFPLVPYSVFQNHSAHDVARSMVYRVYKIHDLPRIRELLNEYPRAEWKNLTSLYDEVKIQVQFNSKISEKIAKNGFLNFHQTGVSNGLAQENRRFLAEQFYWGLNLSTLPGTLTDQTLSVFPKYGYAAPLSATSGFVKNNQF